MGADFEGCGTSTCLSSLLGTDFSFFVGTTTSVFLSFRGAGASYDEDDDEEEEEESEETDESDSEDDSLRFAFSFLLFFPSGLTIDSPLGFAFF